MYLKEGQTLIHARDKTLIRLVDQKILLQHDQWHTLVQPEDFLALYSHSEFSIARQEDAGIDEQKDIEYYQWAARHQ